MISDYDDELTRTAGPPATSKQSIVGTAGAAIVGGRVKDSIAARDWAAGEPPFLRLQCVTALVGATGGLQADIVVADDAALTTNPVVIGGRKIAAAALTTGALIPLGSLLPGTSKRYLGLKLTPLTTDSTQGEVIVGFSDQNAGPVDGMNAW